MPKRKFDWEKIPCLPETELKSNWNPVNTRKTEDGLIKLYKCKCNNDKFERSCPLQIRKVLMNNGEIIFERNGRDHDHHEDLEPGTGSGVAKCPRKCRATVKKTSRISIKIEKKRKERSCLFCWKPCQRLKNGENLDLEEIEIPGAEECPQLRTQLQNFFILRNILELDVSKCEEILKEVDYDSRFMVCDSCLEHVREAWRLHQKILLLRSLEEKLRLLKEEMRQTLLKSEEFDAGHGISVGLENKIREMVGGGEPNVKIRKIDCAETQEEREVHVKKEVNDEDIMMIDDDNRFDLNSGPVSSPPSPASPISNSNNEYVHNNDDDFVPNPKPKSVKGHVKIKRGRGRPKLAQKSIEELKSPKQLKPTKDIEDDGKAQTLRRAGSGLKRKKLVITNMPDPSSPSDSFRFELPKRKRMKKKKEQKQPPVPKNRQYVWSWSCPEIKPEQCDFKGMYLDLLKHMEEVHNFSVDNISESPNDVAAYSMHDFYCDICKRRYATAAFFQKHRALEHPETQNKEDVFRQFQCTHCEHRFPSARYLESHLIVKHSTKKMEFVCPVCGLEYVNKWKLLAHTRTNHPELHIGEDLPQPQPQGEPGKIHKCNYCDFTTPFYAVLHRHVGADHKNKMCELCGSYFVNDAGLRLHMKASHNNSSELTKFPCPYCRILFELESSVKKHAQRNCKFVERTKLENGKILMTRREGPPEGTRKIIVNSSRRRNPPRRRDPNGTYYCPEEGSPSKCDFHTKWYSALMKHMREKHNFSIETVTDDTSGSGGDSQLICRVCNLRFSNSNVLKTHCDTEHPDDKEMVFQSKYICEECNQDYGSYYLLRRHKDIVHSTAKTQYICDICGVDFSILKSYQRHVRMHKQNEDEGLKAEVVIHNCRYCDFTSPFSLVVSRHTAQEHRTLCCESCGKSFLTLVALKQHITDHHETPANEMFAPCPYCKKIMGNVRNHIKKNCKFVQRSKGRHGEIIIKFLDPNLTLPSTSSFLDVDKDQNQNSSSLFVM